MNKTSVATIQKILKIARENIKRQSDQESP